MEKLDICFRYQNSLYVTDVVTEIATGVIEVTFTDKRENALVMTPDEDDTRYLNVVNPLGDAGYLGFSVKEQPYNPYGSVGGDPVRGVIINAATGKETVYPGFRELLEATKTLEREGGRVLTSTEHDTDTGMLTIVEVLKSVRGGDETE